jgi:anthranilate phosphoribosyltransferase
MNSAAILYVANKVDSLKEGVELSRTVIENSTAKRQLQKIIKYSNT